MASYSARQLEKAIRVFEEYEEVLCLCQRCGKTMTFSDPTIERAWCDDCQDSVPLINPFNEWTSEVQSIARASVINERKENKSAN